MDVLLKKYGLNYSIVNGVNGKKLPKNIVINECNKERSIENMGRELTLGEVGCALSHINIYKI